MRSIALIAILVLSLATGFARAEDDRAFVVETPFGPVTTTLEATLHIGDDGRPVVTAKGSGVWNGVSAVFDLSGSPTGPTLADLRGGGSVTLTLDRYAIDKGVTVSGTLPLTVAMTDKGWTLSPAKTARLALSALPVALPDGLTGLAAPYTFTLPKAFRLTATPKNDGAFALSAALHGTLKAKNGGEIALSGRASSALGADGAPPQSIKLSGTRVVLKGLAFDGHPLDGDLDGIAGTLALSDDKPKIDLSLEQTNLTALQLAPPLRFKTAATLDGAKLRFTATAEGKRHPLRLTVKGTHDTATGQGSASVDIPSLTFLPGGFQPHHLYPRLIEQMQDTDGEVALTGTVAWNETGGLTPNLHLLVRDFSFAHGFAKIVRANTVIDINGLTPPSTLPGQQVAVALIDAGLPLTDAVLTFHLDGGNHLAVDSGSLTMAGGDIHMAPARIPLDGSPFSLNLTADKLDLKKLAALAEIGGLEASGTLKGTLPLTLAGGDIIVKDGILESDGPGMLQYAPAAQLADSRTGGEMASIAWTALKDLRYKALKLTLNGRASDEINIGLSLSGSNPELYDGYPVELNIDISGPIIRAFNQGMEGYRIPDRIRDRMLNFSNR